MRIAIVAALPGELKQLVDTGFRRVGTTQRHARKWIMPIGDDEWVAVCAGMGIEAARRAFVEAEAEGPIDMALSVGWAGALDDRHRPGVTYLASAVIDERTGERFELSGGLRDEVLVSSAQVEQEAGKRRLANSYGAALVDMESATIVRMAQMRGIPVVCIKAVSDDFGEKLPDFNVFIDQEGQMRMGAFLCYVVLRPRYWHSLIRLGRASFEGSRLLANCVFTYLSGPKNAEEVNRTGDVNCRDSVKR